MTDQQLVKYETRALMVESKFHDIVYGVSRKGRGMHIIHGNKEITVAADNVEAFAKEILAVWQTHGKR